MSEINSGIKKIIKNDLAFLFFLLFLTTVAYATSWWNEFLSDDIAGIAQNPSLANFSLQLKTLNFNNILNSLVYKIFGPTPFWYHLLNTGFHLATVVAVYILISVVAGPWPARLTSLLFALHPIQTEAVTWISGLSYVVYTFFILLALLFFISAQRTINYKMTAVSTIFFIFALSSSEKAVVFPLVLAMFVYFFAKLSIKKFVITLPFFTISGLYALLRLSDVGKRLEYVAPSYSGQPTVLNPLIQIPIAIYSYLKLIFFPINLTLYHEFNMFPKWEYYVAVLVTFCFFGSIVFLSWIGKRSNVYYYKLAAFGLIFAVIALMPTLLPISLAWIVAERYIHLGTFGLFLAISACLAMLFKTFGDKQTKVWKYTLVVLGIIYVLLTVKRNLEWKSQDTLWPATVKASPGSAYAHNNMGDYYSRRGDFQSAIKSFEHAAKLRPGYAEATHNLGYAYLQIGDYDNAVKYLKEALEYKPVQYESAEVLGQIYFEKKDYETSKEYVLQAIKYNPNPLRDYVYLFVIYKNLKNENKAEEALEMAQNIAKGNAEKKRILNDLLNSIVIDNKN